MKLIISALLLLMFFGCRPKVAEVASNAAEAVNIPMQYAEGFTITHIGRTKLLKVLYPFQGATAGYSYLLVPHGEPIPKHDGNTKIITLPLTSIVCTSTTHIPYLDYLNETNTLTGFPTTDYISSLKMRKRIEEGKVLDLGIEKGLNLELLATLKPDIVMGYTISSDYGQFKKIEEMGIPVVINAEYLEKHPLGRAEWIKFMAAFFNKEKEADSIFSLVEKSYLATKAMVDKAPTRPSVLSGIVYGDTWFLPGGQNYGSKLFKDAGFKYLWANDSTYGFLQLSFESVYEKAQSASVWIGVGMFTSLAEIKNADQRYMNFDAFKNKQVYTYDARKGAKGGSEYMELGYARPDIILNDLAKIAHPEIFPEYELYFHKKLN